MSSSDGNNNKDELVSQFIAFTGSSDTERASMYLEMSGGNLETAVGLFMEHQGAGGGGAGGASSSSQQDPFAAAAGGGMGGGDDVRAPDATQTMRLMDDHAGPRGIGMMGMGMGMGNPYVPMMDPMIQQQLATSAFARDVVNNAAADDDNNMNNGEDDDSNYNNDDDDDDDDDDSGNVNGNGNVNGDSSGRRSSRNSSSRNSSSSNNNSNRATGLADMFAPPRHLLCNENFEGARAMAKDSKRWLLVNIQRDNEFSCHALNRDVWRDELVENLIGEGFIFWQKFDATSEGSVYAERYKVSDYPHVGIIDPRTRRLMWKKEGWTQQNPLTAGQFSEYAMDFCSRHSFDRPPQAPRPSFNANSTATTGLPTKRPMQEMSEDEQLQAAMRASLTDSGGDSGVGSGDFANDDDDEYDYDDDVVIVDSNGEKVAGSDLKPQAIEKKVETAKPAAQSPPSPQPPHQDPPSILDQLISFDLGDEPEKGARIQFRMPDGKRKIRKFDPSQNVRLVYAFVAQSNPDGKNGKEFILMAGFPPKDLMSDIDNSIESCSLSGEAITVRWK